MFEGSANPSEKSLLITSGLKLTVSHSRCFVMLKGDSLTALDTYGLFIYKTSTTQALAGKASAMLVSAEFPPPSSGETVSRTEEESISLVCSVFDFSCEGD